MALNQLRNVHVHVGEMGPETFCITRLAEPKLSL